VCTVGYGDIVPVSPYEAVLAIIGMLISSGMFSYNFNMIGSIIFDMNKKKNDFKKDMTVVNRFLE
jgi:hypothetical protein